MTTQKTQTVVTDGQNQQWLVELNERGEWTGSTAGQCSDPDRAADFVRGEWLFGKILIENGSGRRVYQSLSQIKAEVCDHLKAAYALDLNPLPQLRDKYKVEFRFSKLNRGLEKPPVGATAILVREDVDEDWWVTILHR
jgi:hypothetical protein